MGDHKTKLSKMGCFTTKTRQLLQVCNKVVMFLVCRERTIQFEHFSSDELLPPPAGGQSKSAPRSARSSDTTIRTLCLSSFKIVFVCISCVIFYLFVKVDNK